MNLIHAVIAAQENLNRAANRVMQLEATDARLDGALLVFERAQLALKSAQANHRFVAGAR